MAIFKKSVVQGNFVLASGVQVFFDAAGYYETENENEIEQLSAIYEQVEARKVEEVSEEVAPVAVKVGTISSATLKSLAK